MSTDFERLNIVLSARDRELSAALDRQTKKIERFTRQAQGGLSRTSKEWDRLGTSSKAAAAPMSKVFNISSSGRFVLQNTAAQVGDMAVQFESGTAASRILAQQLPQVFGGFAALGGALGIVAPLLGTVAAVGIPAAAMMMQFSGDSGEAADEARTFADKLGDLEASLGRADAALVAASAGGLADLEGRYGDVTAKVTDLADALADIEVRAAKLEIGGILDEALGDGFRAEVEKIYGTVGRAVAQAGTSAASAEAEQLRAIIADVAAQIRVFEATGQQVPAALRAQMATLNEELAAVEGRVADIGALSDQLVVSPETLARMNEFQAALEAARASGDFGGIADALSDIRALLAASGQDIDQLVIDALARAEAAARETATTLGDGADQAGALADAASGIAPEIANANAEAAALVTNLGAAMARLAGIVSGVRTAQRKALREAQIRMDTVGDPVGRAGALARNDYLEDSGAASYAAIRSGNYSRLSDMEETADRVAEGAERVAAAEQALAEAEAKFREGAKAGGGGTSGGRSGGGRSGGSGRKRKERVADEVKQYERTLERLADAFDGTGTTAAGYRAELQRLREEYAAGNISADEFEAGMEDVEDRFRRNAQAADRLRSSAASAFASIVTGAESVSDALSNLFAQWSQMFANAAFGGLFEGMGGFDALGSLLSFDGGGSTGSGPRSGGVDGKGGFPAILHPGETVVDHTKGQRTGGAMSFNFAPVINAAGADQAAVDGLRRDLRAMQAQFEGRVVRTVKDAQTRRIL